MLTFSVSERREGWFPILLSCFDFRPFRGVQGRVRLPSQPQPCWVAHPCLATAFAEFSYMLSQGKALHIPVDVSSFQVPADITLGFLTLFTLSFI